MAVGFTPNYSENIDAEHLNHNELLALFIAVVKQMNLEISQLSTNGIIAHTKNGLFSWNAELRIVVEGHSVSITSTSTGSDMFDWGKNKGNVANVIRVFQELKAKLTSEELTQIYTEVEGNLVAPYEDVLLLPKPTITQRIANFFSVFKPVSGYFITPIIVNINILIFIIMVANGVDFFAPTSEDMVNWGANFRPITLEGEWWRLLASCFLHIGVFHLFMNMFALIYIGLLLEPHLGKMRFLSAYLLAGLMASVTSLWWHELTVSAGASGAIFGMYGLFLVLLTTDLFEKNARKALLTSIVIFVGYNLLSGMNAGIDNAAHIGGLIAGIVIGFVYTLSLDEEDNKILKFKIIGSLAVAFSIISFIVCSGLTNDIVIYEQKMKDFAEMEKMALEVYNQAYYYPKEDLLYNIKERGIYYWTENINVVNEIDKLNLPEEIHLRNAKVKTYCELRIKSFDLLYKAISENTDKYKVEIQNYEHQIDLLVSELKANN